MYEHILPSIQGAIGEQKPSYKQRVCRRVKFPTILEGKLTIVGSKVGFTFESMYPVGFVHKGGAIGRQLSNELSRFDEIQLNPGLQQFNELLHGPKVFAQDICCT